MAWAGPTSEKPVWCTDTGKGGATAQSVACTTVNPDGKGPEVAMLQTPEGKTVTDGPPAGAIAMPASYQKFTSQIDLGHYLTNKYHIRTPNELASCEVCHR
jgi:hypothetical protein